MLKPIAIVALLALAPLTVQAQESLPAPGAPPADAAAPSAEQPERPASEREIAAARGEADRLIREARAGDVFTNVTTGASARARHDRSGMVCGFDVGARSNKILVFEQGIGIPRGEDVGCSGSYDGIVHTFYATRYRPAWTAQDALTRAVAEIRSSWPTVRRYEGGVAEASTDRAGRAPLPQTLMAHYLIDLNSVEHYTSVRVAEHEGWIFKQRLTTPMARASEGQLLGAVFWLTLLLDVIDNQVV